MTIYLGSVVHPDFVGSMTTTKAVWQFITGGNVDSGNDASGIPALWALNSCDKGAVSDMRAMNGLTKYYRFDPFWKELEQKLNSNKTVHSRRHGKWVITFIFVIPTDVLMTLSISHALS